MSQVAVYKSSERKQCSEMRLVLYAAGMYAELSAHSTGWLLLVDESLVEAATAELSAYQQDTADEAAVEQISDQRSPVGTLEGIFGYVVVVILCALASWYSSLGQQADAIGHLHVGSVIAGQWWRTVTALTLHVDFLHLCSNLAFGTIFGFLAGQLLGGGVAWLLILLGGAGGNLVNTWVRDASHHSVGASTAVFAALGIVVAIALRPSLRAGQRTMQRWRPLIGGLILLSFLGIGGERTDVTAHLTGFMSGLVGGWSSSYLPGHWLCSTKFQWMAGLTSTGILVFAWVVGFIYG